jgi:hypothetical protein
MVGLRKTVRQHGQVYACARLERIKMPQRLCCLLTGIVLTACSATNAVSADAEMQRSETKTATVKTEVIDKLSTQELWSFQPPVLLVSEGGARIMYWGYDIEITPQEGGWIGMGVAMAGLGDLYEEPVAIRIWAKKSERFLKDQSLAESEGNDDAVALFGASDGEVRLRYTVTPYGEVLVDGASIGKVQ